MSTFIDIGDYDTTIRSEILNAITRNDNAIIEITEDVAVKEMKGYLCARYDADKIFNQTGANRDPLILMFAMDITIYHLHSLPSPVKITENRIDRYNRAIKWLSDVNKGIINPTGLPMLNAPTNTLYIKAGSNKKRGLHY